MGEIGYFLSGLFVGGNLGPLIMAVLTMAKEEGDEKA